MATTIIGTYPIIQDIISSINEYGIQTISYIFTVKREDAGQYTPTTDTEYYGPNTVKANAQYISASALSGNVQFLVTQVSSDNLPGQLTKITVNTAGLSSQEPAPKIMIVPNYPLIFGLAAPATSTNQTILPPTNTGGFQGNGSADRGLGVQMYFATSREKEFDAYGISAMPSIFRGVRLPVPARLPFVQTGGTTPSSPPASGSGESYSWQSEYFGFIKREISMERVGGATLFRLIFAESGRYYTTYCPSVPAGQTVGTCENNVIYDF